MLIKSGLRVLQSVIAISLLLLVAGQTNSQSVGAFDGLTGEYRGSRKGDNFIVWIDSSDAVEAGQQAALLLFNEQDRPRLENFLRNIIDNPAEYYRRVCEEANQNEYGRNHFPDYFRVWNTKGGLILLQDGSFGGRLPVDWEKIENRKQPGHIRNEEYISLNGREYAIKNIRRSRKTGDLASVQLTRTGFIQNFFDNPVIKLTRMEQSTPTHKLLGSYLNSKFDAMKRINMGDATVFNDLPEGCNSIFFGVPEG